MTKEEKYEALLEKAREMINNECSSEQTKAICREFFPELCESEDERMRKGLIEALKTSKTVGELKFILPEPTREECISWLEKQKEQNSVPSRETILGIWELGNFWKENPEERGGLTQLQYIQKYWTEKCDYQKEQKPAECELEDAFKDYTDAGITISCGDMIASPAGKPLFKKGDWVVYDGVLGHGILQVKDIKAGRYTFVDNESSLLAADSDKYLRPLTPKDLIKPAEWSEEDVDMLNSCISSIEEAKENRYAYKETDGDTSYDHEIAWLKSLRPQPKQEWSEEDKEMIECLIRHTQKEFDELCNDRYGHQEIISDLKESCRERINWLENRLKSLRPSWKPSEDEKSKK